MKVIIVGKGTGWWDSPSEGEIWGLNDLCLKKEGITLTFELHDIDKLLDTNFRELRFIRAFREQIKLINKKNIPVILKKPHKLFPSGTIFPLDGMPFRYFTSTPAFMIAYAIYKGATAIDIYGIPLYYEEEFTFERPCIEFWIGYAMGKGIEVTVHKPTYLLTAAPNFGLYSYDWDSWGETVSVFKREINFYRGST